MAANDTETPEKATAVKNRRMGSKSGENQPDAPTPPRNRAKGEPTESSASSSSARGNLATILGALVGVAVGAGGIGAVTWANGCASRGDKPNGMLSSASPSSSVAAPSFSVSTEVPAAPDDSNEPEVAEPDAPKKEAAEEKPWTGPWLGAMAQVTPVYPTARFSKNRLGYLRRGAKVAALDKPIHTDACKQGFYPLAEGGYVCGKYATLDADDSRVKLGVKAPDLDGAMPYKYAYNTAHGTPLYAQVPSKDDMLKYEPYLKDRDKKKKAREDAEKPDKLIEKADQPRSDQADASASPSSNASAATTAASLASSQASSVPADAPIPSATAAIEPDEDEKPWWQRDTKDKPLDIKLSDLDEKDGTLAKRMVKGFFVAIDRGFSWNNRLWYKTTEGLIAPSDRMVVPKTPELRGFDMSSGVKQVGFVRTSQASKFEQKKDGKGFSKKGKAARFTSYALTGKTELDNKQRYYETSDGFWLREADTAVTEPGPRPDRIGADEKWVDVNLTRKTLLAMVGDKPAYAAMISPGKTSANKDKDHRTKSGIFRIREKHVATTMDGDGNAGGDLPYSIMDVPYVEYYDGSYALHAAFWHNNFGREQSHGCVNLAPQDAKWLFFWTEPALPRGWHGVWSSDKRQGSWVVIHE
jgi:lipoprotein-anchoring transpeptidase ErfK/SrfK